MRALATALAMLACCLGVALGPTARADTVPFNASQVAPNIALVHVGNDGVTVELEIFIGDLASFLDILPAAGQSGAEETVEERAARRANFAREGMSIRRPGGAVLPVEVLAVEPRMRVDRASALAGGRDPLTGKAIPAPPEDPRVVFVRLFYNFEGRRPNELLILPPREDGNISATIGMQATDRSVPVSEFRYLSAPKALLIDWQDPWFTRFADSTFNRRAQSGTSAYLYVEPREMRVETLMRLQEIAPWLGTTYALDATLDSDAQHALRDAAVAFFRTRNPLKIDGAHVTAVQARASVLELTGNGFQIVEDGAGAQVNAAFVGVILSYPLTDLPQNAEVTWDVFNTSNVEVPVLIADMASPFYTNVTAERPAFQWVNHLLTYETRHVAPIAISPDGVASQRLALIAAGLVLCAIGVFVWVQRKGLRVPAIALGFAGVAAVSLGVWRPASVAMLFWVHPDKAQATDLMTAVVDTLNLATLETTAAARIEALAPVTTLQSQQDVAAEVERGLSIRVPGGSLARVTNLRNLDVESVSPVQTGRGIGVLANWTVFATASHWGHQHNREVFYRALVELVPQQGYWKITGLTILEIRVPQV